ncbi:MAG: hypothetical protein AAFR64_00975 [Pseudomonadota bacterium]
MAHAIPAALNGRAPATKPRQKILIGTHHKALTVFMARVFRTFASITNRSWDVAGGEHDYVRDVLIDHHSKFRFEFIEPGFSGLHIICDPRDILVSSMHYHRKADEPWLSWPVETYGWKTYQQALNDLPTDEDRLIFEIEGQTGIGIRDMLEWDYNRPGFAELKYETPLGDKAPENFARAIAPWQFSDTDRELLIKLFGYFAIGGPGKKSKHIRNATSGQWQQHFTPRVQEAFDQAFPEAVTKLGFEE